MKKRQKMQRILTSALALFLAALMLLPVLVNIFVQ